MNLITSCQYFGGHCCERGGAYTCEVDRWRRRAESLGTAAIIASNMGQRSIETDSHSTCTLGEY